MDAPHQRVFSRLRAGELSASGLGEPLQCCQRDLAERPLPEAYVADTGFSLEENRSVIEHGEVERWLLRSIGVVLDPDHRPPANIRLHVGRSLHAHGLAGVRINRWGRTRRSARAHTRQRHENEGGTASPRAVHRVLSLTPDRARFVSANSVVPWPVLWINPRWPRSMPIRSWPSRRLILLDENRGGDTVATREGIFFNPQSGRNEHAVVGGWVVNLEMSPLKSVARSLGRTDAEGIGDDVRERNRPRRSDTAGA